MNRSPETFQTTCWSVVLRAGGDADAEAVRASIESLCRDYWRPVHAFFLRSAPGHAESADDLTQGFFEHFLERRVYRAADPAKGRFRAFLLTAAKHYLGHQREKAGAAKRGGGAAWIPWEELEDGDEPRAAAGAGVGEDAGFDAVWARQVISRAGRRLEDEVRQRGREGEFGILKPFLVAEPGPGDYATAGERLGIEAGAVAVGVHRLRRRYAVLVREEVARTVGGAGDVEDELRYLVEILSRTQALPGVG